MKRFGGVFEIVFPLLSCVIVFFLFTSICIHSFLESAERDIYYATARSRTSNDLYQLHNVDGGRPYQPGTRQFRKQRPVSKELEEGSVRSQYEGNYPLSFEQIQTAVGALRLNKTLENVEVVGYDIHRCPSQIPNGYPYTWNVRDVLSAWNPDDTKIPETIHQGLCSIDWNDLQQQAIGKRYQRQELPFLVKNHPEIWKAAERWSHFDYLQELVGDEPYRNEHSTNNHMMYWKLRNMRSTPDGWKPPTEDVELTFSDWYDKAKALEDVSDLVHAEHYYLRLNGVPGGKGDFLYDELPFLAPDPEATGSIFMVEPHEARGINCRLGSKGIIAETHYDQSRNFILMLRGQKRYILAHPRECINMELHPLGHPSARHSAINWSDPKSWVSDKHKHFRNAQVNELVLQAGDGLYLPTSWFHFIVSLNMNYQCNARSGTTYENQEFISICGF